MGQSSCDMSDSSREECDVDCLAPRNGSAVRPGIGTIASSRTPTTAVGQPDIADSSDQCAGSVEPLDGLSGPDPELDSCAPVPTVIAQITVGCRSGDVVISPDSSRAYVIQSTAIAVISSLHHIVGIIPIGGHPKSLMLAADGARLYVNHYEDCMSVIDVAERRVNAIPGASCAQEVITADKSYIYAAHNAQNGGHCASWISVTNTEGRKASGISGFEGYLISDLAVDPEGRYVYAALSRHSCYYQYATGFVSVIDTATHAVVDTIDLGASPDTITVNSDGLKLYATHYDAQSVSAIDLSTNSVTRLALGDAPLELLLTPDDLEAYVVGCSSLSVVDTVTNDAARITVGDLPRRVQITSDGKRAYVSNYGDRTVSVIDTTTQCVSSTIDVGGHPEAFAVSPDGQRLYVSDYWSGILTVIAI